MDVTKQQLGVATAARGKWSLTSLPLAIVIDGAKPEALLLGVELMLDECFSPAPSRQSS